MTVFAMRRLEGRGNYGAIQDLMDDLQIQLGAPHDLMMFARDTDDGQSEDIFIALPERRMLGAFSGFTEIERSELPEYLRTLILREDRFSELFPDIAAKRNSMQRR